MSRHVSSWGRIYGIVAKSFQRFHCSQQPDYFLYPPPILTASPFPSRIRVDKQLNSFPTETHCSTSLYILPLCFFPTSVGAARAFSSYDSSLRTRFALVPPPPRFRGTKRPFMVYRTKNTQQGNTNVKMDEKNMEDRRGGFFFPPRLFRTMYDAWNKKKRGGRKKKNEVQR